MTDVIFCAIVFSGAAKQNTESQGASKKEVERSMGRWFTGARDREGGRKRRQQAMEARRLEDQGGQASQGDSPDS